MSENEPLHGLTCPRCGGVIQIPEGQVIVRCPYCDLRSFVRGERGLRRYEVPQRSGRDDALAALHKFFSSNWAIARDAGRAAQVTESFLVYLPFWSVWGRAAAWAFGQEKVGSGDHSHYEPREVRIVQEMAWNGAACDVGEFGVNQAPLSDQDLEPFDPNKLHASGMVFEPMGAFSQAKDIAEQQFQAQVRGKANLDRISQLFVRFFRQRFGLVYYPLWVLRYLYRGRAFQVVVDGHSGKVLYGKGPGNTLYRAAILVLGMALGAFLAIDVPAFLMSGSNSNSSSSSAGGLLALFVLGLLVMVGAYRAFRYGEQFEYRSSKAKALPGIVSGLDNPLEALTSGMDSIKIKDVEKWVNRLS